MYCNKTLFFAYRKPLLPFFVLFLNIRVHFLFGGGHGEFRFLPPPGYASCSEALLPKVKLRVEPCQKYISDCEEGKKELIGPLVPVTPVTFTPTPVDISKVTSSTHRHIFHLKKAKFSKNIMLNKYSHPIWSYYAVHWALYFDSDTLLHKSCGLCLEDGISSGIHTSPACMYEFWSMCLLICFDVKLAIHCGMTLVSQHF